MPSEPESSDFEDEALENIKPEHLTMGTTSLLGSTLEKDNMSQSESLVSSLIRELIDANINADLTKMLQFLLDHTDTTKAWTAYASYIRSLPLEVARKCYNILFERFPTTGIFVVQYCQLEEKAKNIQRVVDTLERFLPCCPSIPLWTYYCEFFWRHHLEGKVGRRLAEARSEVERVYSYAADTVGFFIDSDELWKSYGSFLESYPREGTDINTQGELMRLKRSFFHRAVVIPFHALESFWTQYSVFEDSIIIPTEHRAEERAQIAMKQKSVVDDDHKLANEEYKLRNECWQLITLDDLPLHEINRNGQRQVEYWMKAIEYEQLNPMRLPENQLYHQMHMTYLRCLTTFRFCPDIWIAFAEYESNFDKSRAAAVLNEAVTVMPNSVFLRLACCDFFEEHEMMQECEDEYERLIREYPCCAGWTSYLEYLQRQKGEEAMVRLFERACSVYPCSEVYVKAAFLMENVNRKPEKAKAIYESGLNQFGDNTLFLLKYAEFIQNQNDPEKSIQLLQEHIVSVKEEERHLIWEKLIQIRARFFVCKPVKEIMELENEYSAQVPSERNEGLLSRVDRYSLWGKSFQSIEDRCILKRRCPFEKKTLDLEDKMTKEQEEDILPSLPQADDSESTKVETPKWIYEYLRKLPSVGMKQARNEHVLGVIRILSNITIPDPSRLIVSSN